MAGELTRRKFLRLFGLSMTGGWGASAAAAEKTPAPETPAVLADLTRCIGCRACVRSCNSAHGLPLTPQAESINLNELQTLTHAQWTVVNAYSVRDRAGRPLTRAVKRQCMHCLEPACASACPVGALHRTGEGPIAYRAERCIGCRYCMVACPFDVPKFQWDSGLSPVIGKCQFCLKSRLQKGLSPACVASCPTGALKFDRRERILFEAQARLHARPDKYVDHVYGEKEAGGTSWLYISDVPFDQVGFRKDLPDEPLMALTRAVLASLPIVAAVLAAGLGSASQLLRRGKAPE